MQDKELESNTGISEDDFKRVKKYEQDDNISCEKTRHDTFSLCRLHDKAFLDETDRRHFLSSFISYFDYIFVWDVILVIFLELQTHWLTRGRNKKKPYFMDFS